MKHLASMVLASGVFIVGAAFGPHAVAAEPTVAGESAKPAAEPVVAALAVDPSWPPTGCPDANGIRTLKDAPAMGNRLAYLGLYSADADPTANGNRFWLGTSHGQTVQAPNSPLVIPVAAVPGQGWLLRWNISDAVKIGDKAANQTVSDHYAFDYNAARDGDFAVNALAINKCTTTGRATTCEQALFGKKAWQADASGSDPIEICPPVILSEDPNSLYAYDLNQNTTIETYEYSLALILGGSDGKQGLRIIIDPRIQNGGVSNR